MRQLSREEMAFLFDINECCENIFEFIKNIKTYSEYKGNKLVRKAVERDLITIGEAIVKLNKLSDLVLTNQEKIRAFRNRLVHDYNQIRSELVWVAITRYLSELHKEVNLYLDKK